MNRILRDGGHFVLTTPNVAALRGVSAILQGYHRDFFTPTSGPRRTRARVDARHNREYTPREIHKLLETSGFAVERLETGEFRDEPHPEFGWVVHLLERYRLETDLRGRRHLRSGPQDRRGARALSGLAVFMSAAYEVTKTGEAHVELLVRNQSQEMWRAGRRLRRGVSSLRFGHRHLNCRWRARAAGARCRTGRGRCRSRSTSNCHPRTAAIRCWCRRCANRSAGITSAAGRWW